MNNDLQEQVIKALIASTISSYQIAKDTGISDQTIQNYRNKITKPKGNNLAILSNYLGIIAMSYITNATVKAKTDNNVKPLGTAVSSNDLATELPYIPVAATASFVDTFYDYPDNYTPDTYPVIPRNGEKLSAEEYAVFEVEGESMLPSLRPGSLILAKRIPEQKWDHDAAGVVVVVYGKSIVIKRVKDNRLFGTNTLTLTSDNARFGDLPLTRPEIRAIYRAKRIISSEIL